MSGKDKIFAGFKTFIFRFKDGVRAVSKKIAIKIAAFRFSYRRHHYERKLISSLSPRRFPRTRQLKYLGRFLSATEKKIFLASILGLSLSLLVLLYSFFSSDLSVSAKRGGEYIEGIVGQPLYINPLLSQTNDADRDLSRLIFNGLVRIDENGNITGDLAEYWSVSEDQKKYTFKIRDDVLWHDGEKLTPGDVLYTFNAIRDKAVRSPLRVSFDNIAIEITGENQIVFTLPEPYAGFLPLLTVGIIPQHVWYEIPNANFQLAIYNQKPVGTGPFKFKSLVKDRNGSITSYALESNKDYHLGQPYLDRMTFKFFDNYENAIEALQNGAIEGLGFLPKKFAKEISKRNFQIYEPSLAQFTAVFLNSDKNRLLADSKVVQALKLATNKQAIFDDILSGNGRIIHSAALPGMPGYDESISDSYDPIKAAEILTADGWSIQEIPSDDPNNPSKEEAFTKKGTPLIITLTTLEQPESIALVSALKDQWSQIGVKVNVSIIDKTSFVQQTLKGKDYEALVYGGLLDFNADPFPYWHSSQRIFPGVNLSNYSNRKTDDLIEQARKESDPAKRDDLQKQIHRLINSDSVAIFLYSPSYSYPVSRDIKGISIPRIITPSDRFWNVNKWYMKTGFSL